MSKTDAPKYAPITSEKECSTNPVTSSAVVVEAHDPIMGIPNLKVSNKPKSPDPKKTAKSQEFVSSEERFAAAAAWYKIAIGPVVETNTTSKPEISADQEAALGSCFTLWMNALPKDKSEVPASNSDINLLIYLKFLHGMDSTRILN